MIKISPHKKKKAPVEEPPNAPKKPPVKEPDDLPLPEPPPTGPPAKEPPNAPKKPPVKEPPPKERKRKKPWRVKKILNNMGFNEQ